MNLRLSLIAALWASPALAGVLPIVLPLPRSTLPELAEADDERDPAKLAARIGENARAVSDRLAARDTGTATRRTHANILRDIDRLLDQANNSPPPMGGSSGNPPPMPMRDQQPMPMGDQQPMPMNGEQPMPTGGQQPMPMGSQQPMGGQHPMPMGEGSKSGKKPSWRDKLGDEGDAPMPQPPPKQGGDPKPAQPESGGAMGRGTPGKPPPTRPVLPAEDAVAKQVWGHLPEQLRQEVNQYYKEQFMPKYGDMLRDYYTGLAEASKPGVPHRAPSP